MLDGWCIRWASDKFWSHWEVWHCWFPLQDERPVLVLPDLDRITKNSSRRALSKRLNARRNSVDSEAVAYWDHFWWMVGFTTGSGEFWKRKPWNTAFRPHFMAGDWSRFVVCIVSIAFLYFREHMLHILGRWVRNDRQKRPTIAKFSLMPFVLGIRNNCSSWIFALL